MFGFYIILAIAILYVSFMGGVIGYLIGRYWKKIAYEEDYIIICIGYIPASFLQREQRS